MTQIQAYLLISLNFILVVLVALVAYCQVKGYNILVKQGANHTTAPARVPSPVMDEVEIKVPLQEVRLQCALLEQEGYRVVRSKGVTRGELTLVMTKTLNGDSIRQARKNDRV